MSSLYAVCPQLIDSGRVHIATPPEYSLTYQGQRGASKKKQYIVDKPSLVHWMTQNIYKPSLDIEVAYEHPHPKTGELTSSSFKLTGREYDGFVQQVMRIGDVITNLSKELVIDPLILETMTFITYYLTPQTMDVDRVREVLGVDHLFYDPENNILTVSIGRDDYTIPLYRVQERLYEELMPVLNTIQWRKLQVYITSLNDPAFNRSMMTIGQLHAILKRFDDLFYIKQFKGLGSMPSADCFTTCMDPNHRTVYPITSMSDVTIMQKLLGRDSEHRKRLLVGQVGAR